MESSTDMDDISYLIHLEAYKRFKYEETHLRRTVEEKTKQYIEVKNEFLNIYAKYTELLKLSATREALQTAQFNEDVQIDAVAKSIEKIIRKISVDRQLENLPAHTLQTTKDILSATQEFKRLPELQQSTESNKNRIDFIQSSLARVESKLETSIASGLDAFVKRVEDD